MLRKVSIALALLAGNLLCGSALACTAEGGRLAAEAREEARLELRKVRGTYRVLSVAERSEERFGQQLTVRTYSGRITTTRGRTFDTSHEGDDTIELCMFTHQPVADAEGLFFLKRAGRGVAAPYRLIDWDGAYLVTALQAEK